MTWCIYLTHPEVRIDPEIPVPEWGLSDIGRARARLACDFPFAEHIRDIVSSGEVKAKETARVFAEGCPVRIHIRQDLHENDRSATGFLPPAEFEETADRFFAEPHASIRGWERAIDAQTRIVSGVREALSDLGHDAPVLFTGHGAVGTLLMCHLMNVPISRSHDQKRGGCWYRFERDWLTSQAGRDLNWTEL
ncbi:histidine phosphatase family protein [Roseibium aggregatum]|uniref:Histidine phosphatase family protein n=1 Tax=Roseibium aggregatum TaxID=187304 RepID=A0A939EGI5_9HYPH|nr:histidine phosphatase family protein [Roseibium aggregatum]MBN9672812.1 histidine phosphatase family protein [Roseibium aggregatum]